MGELILVRHAATAWSGRRYCGRTDLPLTVDGQSAARTLGRELRSAALPGPVRIVSSPLLRARQTADAIAKAMGADGFAVDARWVETDFGAAEGLTFAELEASRPQIAARLAAGALDIDWPGGETAAALRTRVEDAWLALTEEPGSWVVVAHGGPLRIAIALATGVAPASVAAPAPGTVWRRSPNAIASFPV